MRHLGPLAARFAALAYNHPDNVAREVARYGYRLAWFDHADAQAYLAEGAATAFLVFRGTEASAGNWSDIWANFRFPLRRWAGEGQVHEGYADEVDKLWDAVRPKLARLPGWCAVGHSLGGVMATLCAARAEVAEDAPEAAAIFSFGSPKPGDNDFAASVLTPHFRYVNRRDFAPRCPPLPGRAHIGPPLAVDSGGWTGPLRDHDIDRYAAAVAAQEARL